MNKSIKVHEETYDMLREMAEKHGRKITKELDIIIQAKYAPRKFAPVSESISDEESVERR